jgi:hypothetical protein
VVITGRARHYFLESKSVLTPVMPLQKRTGAEKKCELQSNNDVFHFDPGIVRIKSRLGVRPGEIAREVVPQDFAGTHRRVKLAANLAQRWWQIMVTNIPE